MAVSLEEELEGARARVEKTMRDCAGNKDAALIMLALLLNWALRGYSTGFNR